MKKIREIQKSDKKRKEKVSILAERIVNQKINADDLVKLLQEGNDIEKVISAETMKFISKRNQIY